LKCDLFFRSKFCGWCAVKSSVENLCNLLVFVLVKVQTKLC